MRELGKIILIIGMLSVLTGCLNDLDPSAATTTNTTVSTTSDSATLQLGNGSGTSFTASVLSIGVTPLSAGGSTSITATIADANGSLYTKAVVVAFTSTCSASGTAQLDTSVSTISGIAISTYVAKGCQGNDTITASADVDGASLIAIGTVNVLSAALGSIEFVSATPPIIALKGTGGAGLSESSTVVFKVKDEAGGSIANQTVDFTLNTTVGGLTLGSASGTTNSNGEVQLTVKSGTVPTAVRVTATVSGSSPAIATQSDQLVVSTGIPDQDSMSLSADTLNPEAWNLDGTAVQITAHLADRYNNPVPDGTAISFTTEGGSIESSCTTVDGACSVTWTSQNPRPCGQVLGQTIQQADPVNGQCLDDVGTNSTVPTFTSLGQPYGGRATIIATAVGEESFFDANANGVFDDGDTFVDQPEAFLDIDEDGVRDSNEPFSDFNVNGSYDAADGKFNGVLCQHTTLCATKQTIHVRSSLVLVMSGSTAYIYMPSSITLSNGSIAGVQIYISDLHNQPMPAGSKVEVSTSLGTLLSSSSFSLPNTSDNSPYLHEVVFKGAGATSAAFGVLLVKVTTPDGLAKVYTADISELEPNTGADLEITSVTDSIDPLTKGNDLTYTVTVTNNGPEDATGVILTSTLPDGTYFLSSGPVSCYGSPLICPIGNLTNGMSTSVTITVDTNSTTAPGSLAFTTTVSGTKTDLDASNDSGGQNTQVLP